MPEHEKLGQHVLFYAVFGDRAVLELKSEASVEGLVLLSVVCQQLFKLGLYLLFKISCDYLELAVVLQHFARDVQGQVLRIHDAAHKAEAFGKEGGAVFHYHYSASVKLKSCGIIAGVIVVGRLFRYEEQRLVGHEPLSAHEYGFYGVLGVEVLLAVEAV